jgi:Cu(I)/Ag(I) efflux system membrane fusion protein
MSARSPFRFVMAVALAAVLLALGVAIGRWWAAGPEGAHDAAHTGAASASASAPAAADGRRVLYWYDPMVPQHRFDRPGKSPFMDMDLVPRYADEGEAGDTVRIDPAVAQNLGLRLATVTRGPLHTRIEATGVLGYNERDVTVVQARTEGFVERVAPLAPGDVVAAGQWLAELLVPAWVAVQQEFLAVRALGDDTLTAAARERMRLAGLPEALLREVEASGQPRTRVRITAPRRGVIEELGVREGMTVMAGQTLARLNSLDPVWLEVAVPEAQSAFVQVGQAAEVRWHADPGQVLKGRVTAVLPTLSGATRTLRVRMELPNPDGRLRPGQTAQASLVGATAGEALRVPTEAVIRTGRRAVVMRAEAEGRYRPVEVQLGAEVGDETLVLEGLAEGDRVVASGPFLIDSEASLRGVLARARGEAAGPVLHEAEATLEDLLDDEVVLDHGPFPSLNMPAMTMAFPLARPELAQGLRPGMRVKVGVRQTDRGLVVERLDILGGPR